MFQSLAPFMEMKRCGTTFGPFHGQLDLPFAECFHQKKCIQDNFLYVRNLARAYHRTKTPALMIKLDISKAFDSVSWEYLMEMLQYKGFPPRWRDWLALILSTSTSSVRLDGVLVQQSSTSEDCGKGILCPLTCSSCN